MKTKVFLTFLIAILSTKIFAQTYDKPYVESVGDRICFITSVQLTKQYTIVSFEHLNNDGWITLNPKIFIRTNDDTKIGFVKAEGIPLSPAQYQFKKGEEKHAFKVYFKPLPSNVKVFDIIEVDPGTRFDFNFYGVNLDEKRTSDEQKPHFDASEETVSTEVVLTPPPPVDEFGIGSREAMESAMQYQTEMLRRANEDKVNYYKQPGKLDELAELNKAYFQALISKGFSRTEALQIVLASPLNKQ